MFDVGFWELAIIMIVAMLVIGPERLPKVARTVGLWLGRARSAFNSVKADIDRELRAEELKTMLSKQADEPELRRFREELSRDIESAPPETRPTAGKSPAADAPASSDTTPPARGDERD